VKSVDLKRWFPLLIVGLSAVIIGVVSLMEDPVVGLLEIALLLVGMAASYVYGQQSLPGGDARPHARKAYRRMVTLSGSLYALSALVADEREVIRTATADRGQDHAGSTLRYVEHALGQSVNVVTDAMEDWADVVPDAVEELRALAEQRQAEAEKVADEVETFAFDPDDVEEVK
jgi:hypothetical protein